MVEFARVTRRFGAFAAVDDLTLRIRAGEFITLLGPSGCGKTTLLRIASGFETPDAGAVLLEGRDVTRVPPYRRDVNQVFQSYALFPHLTVRQNIGFGLRMKRVPRAEAKHRVEEVIALVSLAGMEDRKPHQLSGGQKQRVALARAIVCRPKVLLLDEPLAALDAKLRRSMQVELKRLQQRLGITFVFVTHDQEEALTMSDRIAVMDRGRIEQVGDAADVYNRPRTAFVAGFIGQANLLRGQWVSGEGLAARVRVDHEIELEVAGDASPPGIPAGAAAALVLVRPERLSLSIDRPPGGNVFEAEIREQLFKGVIEQFLLRTRSGLDLTAVTVRGITADQRMRVGSSVYCQVQPNDVVVVG
jgi:spermidine/putrescine transport system ATP-binding protein